MKENKRIKTTVERSKSDLSTLLGFKTESEELKFQSESKLARDASAERETKRILLEAEARKGQAIRFMNALQKY